MYSSCFRHERSLTVELQSTDARTAYPASQPDTRMLRILAPSAALRCRLHSTLGSRKPMSRDRAFLIFLKYVCPAILLVHVFTAVIGHVAPWQPAREFLLSQTGQTPVQVGFGCSFKLKCTSAQYVLLPSALSSPTSVTLRQSRGEAALSIVVNEYGFLVWLARVAGLTLITWWFWLRPSRRLPNISLKR